MSKRYKLLNEVKTIPEWVRIFPYLWGMDFADPKFGFEEVKEVSKDWEIFQLERKSDYCSYTLTKEKTFYLRANDEEFEMGYEEGLSGIKEGWCTIKSVKRLSDGEVFTVGDVIEFCVGDIRYANIEKFEIHYFNKNNISAYHKYAGRGFKAWKKKFISQPTTNKEEPSNTDTKEKFPLIKEAIENILNK